MLTRLRCRGQLGSEPTAEELPEVIDSLSELNRSRRTLAGEAGIQSPIFEPGDAIFFDGHYPHRPAVEPEMPDPRYAIEYWFFGPSAFPGEYIPLAP